MSVQGSRRIYGSSAVDVKPLSNVAVLAFDKPSTTSGGAAARAGVRRRGILVLSLGADVPVSSWLDLRAQVQPRLLVVAVVTAEDRSAASDVARALRAADDPTPVAFGGRAAGSAAQAIDGSTVLPDSIVAATDRAMGLLSA